MRRRIICLILACFMTLPLFSGCGTEQSVTEPSATATATDGAVSPSPSDETDSSDKLNLYLTDSEWVKYLNACGIPDLLNVEIMWDVNNLEKQLLPELLAGGGPDIFIFTNETLPNFRNYMKQGAFADLNELIEADTSEDPLNIEDYNAAVIETGMWEDKRCFFPISYSAEFFVTTQEMCEEYDIAIPENGVALEEMPEVFSNYIERQRGKGALTFPGFILEDIAFTYMDMSTRSASFDTEEFHEVLRLGEEIDIYPWGEMQKRGYRNDPSAVVAGALFCKYHYGRLELMSNPYNLQYDYLKYDPQTPIMFGRKDLETGGYTAHANVCFAINANSDKKELAYDLLKNLLSEKGQGGEGEYKLFGMRLGIPVLNSVRTDCLSSFFYEILPEYVPPEERIPNDEAGKAFIEKYIEICSNVTKCYMVDGKWREEIWDPARNDYEDGKITAEQFAQTLQQKSNIYLKE